MSNIALICLSVLSQQRRCEVIISLLFWHLTWWLY